MASTARGHLAWECSSTPYTSHYSWLGLGVDSLEGVVPTVKRVEEGVNGLKVIVLPAIANASLEI